MFFFSAYECSIESSIDLSGFTHAPKEKPNVIIRLAPPILPKSSQKEILSIHKIANGLRFHWRGVASYEIVQGQEVIITPESNADSISKLLAQPLYGMAIAAILHQRHHLILHGSTVEIDGKAMVLLGNKGFGKSTLTASLLSQGHGFICDDVTALLINPPFAPQVIPGIPRLKLWPDSARATGHDPDKLPLVSSTIPKHVLPAHNQFKNKRIPLQTIVLLEYGHSIALQEMKEPEKMLCLLGGQYFAKFHKALQHSEHRRLFHHYSILARSVDIVRLTIPKNLQLLPVATKLLEQYMCAKDK